MTIQLRSLPWCFSLACLLGTLGCAQEIAPPQVLNLEGSGFQLRVFDNSETLSSASAINSLGHILGFRETVDESGNIFSRTYFFSDGQSSLDLPNLQDFSNTEVTALSDAGIAVGFASRAVGNPDGSLAAIVWDLKNNQLTRLAPFPGDGICHAQDVSADGTRITGYTTGSEPSRLRPCVWTLTEKRSWECEVLPTIKKFNPFLMSSGVIISPDGKRIAACITERFLENGIVDSSLYAWEYKDGKWDPSKLTSEQMHLRDINNEGIIVGRITQANGQKAPCIIDWSGELTLIDLLPNCVSGEAMGVNKSGLVVGVCDEPSGPEGGPHAFLWKAGKTTPLTLPKDTLYSSASAVNDVGQIAGLADITFPEKNSEDIQAEDAGPLVKSLAFVWTPTTN